MEDGKGIDDLLIVDDLRPHPTSIGEQGNKNSEEYYPFV